MDWSVLCGASRPRHSVSFYGRLTCVPHKDVCQCNPSEPVRVTLSRKRVLADVIK